ncbi:MAG TPA: DNA polymerase domain-containing protein, partial [Candidatus Limnocylindria bacterium]|nr:DNA polymerase domain-containing protein [Candidatus Limnocylindria bacterium]
MRVYRRHHGDTVGESVPFAPFLLAADETLLRECAGAVDALEGAGAFRWIARFASWAEALAARDRCREASGAQPNLPTAPYRFLTDPVHQYLLASGRTSFGGMRFGDVRRLTLDIEVITSEGHEFPSAARAGDAIIAIALADSTGFRRVLRGDEMDETALLHECGRVIAGRDPDVVEGHNIFRFDLEYIDARARRHGVPLAWGREGALLRSRISRLQVAERSIGFRRYEAPGRHIVDTWMLAQLYDVGARDLPGFGLKDIARHLGVAAPDRTYIDPAEIPRLFREEPDRLMAYAADDAVETLDVSAILSPPYFAQAQLLPFDYQAAMLRGSAAKIDALLLREYLRRGHAIPAPRRSQPVGGGLAAIWHQGVAGPVLHVDVTSLYPSLMLAKGMAPASDGLGVFLDLLGHLRELRVSAKRLAQAAASEEERLHQNALSASFKILINSFYGYLAFGGGHWNDFEVADRVTSEGRALVTAIIDRLRALGATPIEADTDGVYFVAPPDHRADDDARLLEAVAAGLPATISLELDGRYAAMFSYKMKNYALLDGRGRLHMKGSGFRSRGLEPFQRQIIQEIVWLLVAGRGGDAKGVIDRWLADFAAHAVPVRAFARTEYLQEPLETYRARVHAGERAPSAVYELALASGRAVQPGDQVSYYVTGRTARVAVN